jgi:hypothetical protein
MPVRDRASDIWKPLILVADAAGGKWPDRARAAAVFLAGSAKAKTKSGNDRELLLHIRDAFFPGDHALHSDELVRRLCNRDESPWDDKHKPLTTNALAARLKQYDIPPPGAARQMKLNGVNRNGYHRDWFDDAWKRHVDPMGEPNSTASTASTKLTNKDKKVEEVERVEFPQMEGVSAGRAVAPVACPPLATAQPDFVCQDTIAEAHFEERAAILEYDGGLSREEAETVAAAEWPELPDFLRRR